MPCLEMESRRAGGRSMARGSDGGGGRRYDVRGGRTWESRLRIERRTGHAEAHQNLQPVVIFRTTQVCDSSGRSIIMASSTRREASAKKGAIAQAYGGAGRQSRGHREASQAFAGSCAHNGRTQVPGRRANRVPYLPEHRHCPSRQQQGRFFHWAGSPRHCAGGSISRCGRHQAPGSPVSDLSSRHRQ